MAISVHADDGSCPAWPGASAVLSQGAMAFSFAGYTTAPPTLPNSSPRPRQGLTVGVSALSKTGGRTLRRLLSPVVSGGASRPYPYRGPYRRAMRASHWLPCSMCGRVSDDGDRRRCGYRRLWALWFALSGLGRRLIESLGSALAKTQSAPGSSRRTQGEGGVTTGE